jgi:hypothetical protein
MPRTVAEAGYGSGACVIYLDWGAVVVDGSLEAMIVTLPPADRVSTVEYTGRAFEKAWELLSPVGGDRIHLTTVDPMGPPFHKRPGEFCTLSMRKGTGGRNATGYAPLHWDRNCTYYQSPTAFLMVPPFPPERLAYIQAHEVVHCLSQTGEFLPVVGHVFDDVTNLMHPAAPPDSALDDWQLDVLRDSIDRVFSGRRYCQEKVMYDAYPTGEIVLFDPRLPVTAPPAGVDWWCGSVGPWFPTGG